MIRLVLALSVVTAAFSEAAPNKMAPSVTSRIFRKLSDQADSSFTPVTNDETSAQATPIAMPEVSSLTFSNPPKAKECSDDEDNPGELWFKPDKCIKISPETGSADYGAKFACENGKVMRSKYTATDCSGTADKSEAPTSCTDGLEYSCPGGSAPSVPEKGVATSTTKYYNKDDCSGSAYATLTEKLHGCESDGTTFGDEMLGMSDKVTCGSNKIFAYVYGDDSCSDTIGIVAASYDHNNGKCKSGTRTTKSCSSGASAITLSLVGILAVIMSSMANYVHG